MNKTRQHIMVHDFCGHPFSAELSRALASKGFKVDHVFFPDEGGPKGHNSKLDGDPENLGFFGVEIDVQYSKTNFFKRRSGDVAYGHALRQLIKERRPDIVISGNTPTEAQEGVFKGCQESDAKFIYWCQDFYSIAVRKILAKRLPGLGHIVGYYYTLLERRQMSRASHIVHITEGFYSQTDRWNIPRDNITVIPNWGLIDEIALVSRDNPWSKRHGLGDRLRVVYSGTLAMKHNPDLLLSLVRELGDKVDVVVVGFGVGAQKLSKYTDQYENLTVLPLQDFSDLGSVLSSGDILVAFIERDAGEFSVPSKVLSYLCAARPIVLAANKENLASTIVLESGAGSVIEPEDHHGFVEAVRLYTSSEKARNICGANGRKYAEENFDLSMVSKKFAALFTSIIS